MKTVDYGKKRVFIVEKHHQALGAWELFRGANVFSLDYHNDSKLAFLQTSFYALKPHYRDDSHGLSMAMELWAEDAIAKFQSGEKSLDECIGDLQYNEHPDFAVRSGIIRRFFVLAMSDGNSGERNKRVFDGKFQKSFKEEHSLVIYAPKCVPGCTSIPHDEDCRYKRADSVLESAFLDPAVDFIEKLDPKFFDRYILDIDLDYFSTSRGLEPKDSETFGALLRGAEAVTVAMERECVRSFRLPGEAIEAEGLLEQLSRIFEDKLSGGTKV